MAILADNNDMNPPSHAVYIMLDVVQGMIVPCILENLVCDFLLSTWYNSYVLEFCEVFP